MPQFELALARQERLSRIADTTSQRAVKVWQAGASADIDRAWAALGPQLTAITAAGQIAAAAGASPFLASTARADDVTDPSAGTVEPVAYAGVDASGRTLDGLLYGAVIAAKSALGAGSGLQGAFMTGATFLAVMAHTAVLDTGRSADLTAMTARSYTHYIRVVSSGACSRCAILAGIQSARNAFLRHPRCRCTAAPETDPKAVAKAGKFASPSAYFESLTSGEQDRIFTRAGAEAIRAGADPISIVSARRNAVGIDYSRAIVSGKTLPNSGRRLIRTVIGHRPDGTPVFGYTTGEGTTVRGAFAKRERALGGRTQKVGTRYSTVKRIRLMPETIVDLTDDVTLRQVLLRDAGYLRTPWTAEELRSPLGGTFFARRDQIIRDDRQIADAFYREHGISLG